MKKIKYYLQHFSALWSLPAMFLLFAGVGYLLVNKLDLAAGTYDLGFIQPLFLAACIVIGITFFSKLAMRFNFFTIYKYIWGKKQNDGKIKNISKEDWRTLSPLQNMIIALVVFFCFFFSFLFLYLKFV